MPLNHMTPNLTSYLSLRYTHALTHTLTHLLMRVNIGLFKANARIWAGNGVYVHLHMRTTPNLHCWCQFLAAIMRGTKSSSQEDAEMSSRTGNQLSKETLWGYMGASGCVGACFLNVLASPAWWGDGLHPHLRNDSGFPQQFTASMT